METSGVTAPSTAIIAPRATNSETDTHRIVSLAFGKMQTIPNFKMRNNI
jgi:hypothetical protein